MRVVSPQELISTIRSSVRSIPEHHHGLFDSHSHLGARFGALGLGTGLNGEDGMQMQMNTVRQLVMAALNHVLQNLQTVEGGQEAAVSKLIFKKNKNFQENHVLKYYI